MEVVDKFLSVVRQALSTDKIKELDSELLALKELNKASGATKENVDKLKKAYPQCPKSLIALLENIDGTYHRKYNDETVSMLIFGSEAPSYYLLSIEQMIEKSKDEEDISYLTNEDEVDPDDYEDGIAVDIEINQEALYRGKYLCFSHCMNNGGSSRLYIDFNPTDEGVCGQIVSFIHDPDEYKVIVDSFDEFLQQQIEDGLDYLEDYADFYLNGNDDD